MPTHSRSWVFQDLEIGDVGLQLGDVQYHPRVLTARELEEIYEDGAPLSQIVNGGSPEGDPLDDFDRLGLQVQDSTSTLGFQTKGVQAEVLDLQSASSLTIGDAIDGINTILDLESKILDGERLLLNGSSAALEGPAVDLVADAPTQICLTSNTAGTCSWSGDLGTAQSVYLVQTTAQCGDSAAIGFSVTPYGIPTPISAFGPGWTILPVSEATQPVELYLCGAATVGASLVHHDRLIGTLSIRADRMATLLDEQAKFGPSGGPFYLPDPFGDPTDFSISAWIRQNKDDIGFFVGKRLQEVDSPDQPCWSFRSSSLDDSLRVEGISPDGNCPEDADGTKLCASCEVSALDNQQWRHVAFTVADAPHILDPVTSLPVFVNMYVDGELICQRSITTDLEKPKQCTGGALTVGVGIKYNINNPFIGEMRDMKYYDTVLTAAEVTELSVCVDPDIIDDTTFVDTVGHSCQWYDEFQRKYQYSACSSATKERCPIACRMFQLCPAGDSDFQIFERVQKMIPPTLCLDDTCTTTHFNFTPPAAEEEAGRRSLSATNSSGTSSSRRQLSHIPVPNCDNFEEFTEPNCKFNPAETTVDLNNANWQEFTLYFWSKGPNLGLFGASEWSDQGSMTHCFEIFHEVLWAYNPTTSSWGNARPEKRVRSDEWLMRGLIVRPGSFSYFFNGEFITTEFEYNCPLLAGMYWGPQGFDREPEQQLQSPVKFFNRALSAATMQSIYYGELVHYKEILDDGPVRSNRERNVNAELKLEPYSDKTFSFLPPIVFQERFTLVPCKGFSADLQTRFKEIAQVKCEAPYECTNFDDVAGSLINCIDDQTVATEGPHFGREPMNFLDRPVWSEFLQIFDASVLVRGGEATKPGGFIDMRTRMLSVMSIFYTPNIDTVTLVRIDFDMTKSRVAGSATIKHYPSIPESWVGYWNVINGCAIFFVALLLIFTIGEETTMLYGNIKMCLPHPAARRTDINIQSESFSRRNDVILSVLMIAFLVTQAVTFNGIRGNIEKTFGELLKLDWSASDVPYQDKVSLYFENVAAAQSMVDSLETVNVVGFVLSFVCLARLIAYLAIHPRIRILPGILATAAHQMTSFMKYSMLIFIVTAVLATNLFGPNNENFSTFKRTCGTQFALCLGETDDFFTLKVTATNDIAMLIYMTTFIGLVVFMLVNLFLSIIVDAYMETKEQLSIVSQECSKSLLSDCWEVVYLLLHRKRFGWPAHADLAIALETADTNADGMISEAEFAAIDFLARKGKGGTQNPMLAGGDLAVSEEPEDSEETGGETLTIGKGGSIFDFYFKHDFLQARQEAAKQSWEKAAVPML